MGGDISPNVERREFFAGEMGKKGEKGEKGGVLGGSPIENADLLYEYFPLSLDDWYVYFYFYLGARVGRRRGWMEVKERRANKRNRMPPVDAIYRPHVVHHTIIPPDLKAQQVKNKTKRYFSADD